MFVEQRSFVRGLQETRVLLLQLLPNDLKPFVDKAAALY
jgi:hypothetical protein